MSENVGASTSRNPKGLHGLYRDNFTFYLYRPDLAPIDFHLFGLLKIHLGGKFFADDEEVETQVQKWLRQQSEDFYAAGFSALAK
jgi:hypothetical protein